MRSGWLCLLLAACGAVPRNEFEQGFAVAPLDPGERVALQAGLQGLDAVRADATWRPGDSVLFGIRSRSADSSERLGVCFTLKASGPNLDQESGTRRTASLTVHDGGHPAVVTSELTPLAATVREPGKDPSELSLWVPRDFLSVSIPANVRLLGSLRAARPAGSEPPPAAGTQLQRAGLAIHSFFDLGRQQPELWRIITEVSDEPSWLSVLTRLGVTVTMRIDFEGSRLLDQIPGFALPLPGCRVPVVMLANDQPVLYLNVYAVEPLPPFHLCGGIVAIEAHRPSDAKVTLRIDLLAARLGGG